MCIRRWTEYWAYAGFKYDNGTLIKVEFVTPNWLLGTAVPTVFSAVGAIGACLAGLVYFKRRKESWTGRLLFWDFVCDALSGRVASLD